MAYRKLSRAPLALLAASMLVVASFGASADDGDAQGGQPSTAETRTAAPVDESERSSLAARLKDLRPRYTKRRKALKVADASWKSFQMELNQAKENGDAELVNKLKEKQPALLEQLAKARAEFRPVQSEWIETSKRLAAAGEGPTDLQ